MQAYHYTLQLLHCMQHLTCSMVSSDISYFTFCSQHCITAVSALNCCRTNKGVRDANTWNESHGPWHEGMMGRILALIARTWTRCPPWCSSVSVSQYLGHHCQYSETRRGVNSAHAPPRNWHLARAARMGGWPNQDLQNFKDEWIIQCVRQDVSIAFLMRLGGCRWSWWPLGVSVLRHLGGCWL